MMMKEDRDDNEHDDDDDDEERKRRWWTGAVGVVVVVVVVVVIVVVFGDRSHATACGLYQNSAKVMPLPVTYKSTNLRTFSHHFNVGMAIRSGTTARR